MLERQVADALVPGGELGEREFAIVYRSSIIVTTSPRAFVRGLDRQEAGCRVS